MARAKKQISHEAVNVTSIKHSDVRKNIPTQEQSAKLSQRDKQPGKKKYEYDPSLDPTLMWSGKNEAGGEFSVATVPIYVQEKIAPEAIIARMKQGSTTDFPTLFGTSAVDQFNNAVEFYKHDDNWQNRMILGDSLIVMNSLLEKEGMKGQVQCVFLDPPYGIKFGSNWQVSTRNRSVKDNKIDDLVRQPEQIKAFRDTWELGIHSYLQYLKDRLTVARDLLTESGSCFVQISDENVHLIRNIMDEVFGSENYVNEICFTKTAGGLETAKSLATRFDYLVWYARDAKQVKFRQLYEQRPDDVDAGYNLLMLNNGETRPLSKEEKQDLKKIPEGSKLFRSDSLTKPGPGSKYEIELDGKKYTSGNRWWGSPKESIFKLIKCGRVKPFGNTLRYIKFLDDFPYKPLNNLWIGYVGAKDPLYVVQTNEEIISRCFLMTTDPGDLILDPTCGSGTSAFVAEQWGRRWITTDTSRVALALARTRLMSSNFPYYKLKEHSNIKAGFEYKTVPHITLNSIANDEPADVETLFDQPVEDKKIVRVTGPFTVESLSPHRFTDAQELVSSERFVQTVIENMLKSGIQTGDKGARVNFINLDILPGGPEIQAMGDYETINGPKKAAILVGPEFGSVDDDMIRDSVAVAKKFADLLIIAGTGFDASAFTEPNQSDGLQVMKVKINPDLSMGNLLKKTGSGNLFIAFGEPEIKINKSKDGYSVELLGVDVYDPVKGEVRSSGSGNVEHDVATWFIDTNYNGDSFFVTHAYFLADTNPFEKLKKVLKADISEDLWDSICGTTSRVFAKPITGKIAVKVINHYGDEVMKIFEIN
jgi:adenine-specific DNA-methyltransferase